MPNGSSRPSLATILREWGRIGCIGFGGPPAHVALLRDLCVRRRRWVGDEDFEHGVAATTLLPGPGSTQLAIYLAWRLRGLRGALVGGAAFIVPGLLLIVPLAALFLGSPPRWIRGVAAGAGAVVAVIALRAAWTLVGPSWRRAADGGHLRWVAYLIAGAAATPFAGPWLVLVLIGCGVVELVARRAMPTPMATIAPWPLVATAAAGGLGALAWTAFKVGALSFGGGFVVIPLMRADAISHHWMTNATFLNAVALGQATPGPVVLTVAVVGYAAHGVGGALLATLVAFAPSFVFVGCGARRFEALRTDPRAAALLAGTGPASIGAIAGAAVPLVGALSETWQYAVLAGGAALLFVVRRGVVSTLLLAGAAGAIVAAAGGPLP